MIRSYVFTHCEFFFERRAVVRHDVESLFFQLVGVHVGQRVRLVVLYFCSQLLTLLLELLDPLLQLADELLTEVASLRELCFDLLVDFNVSF